MIELKVFIDGGCRSNPGPGAWGVYIENERGFVQTLKGFLPQCTNNQAEYKALREACLHLYKSLDLEDVEIYIYSDSQLVVNQINMNWKVNEAVMPFYLNARRPFYDLKLLYPVKLSWIPREENKEADAFCNQVMDEYGIVSNRRKIKNDTTK